MVADRLAQKAYFVQWDRKLDPTTPAPFGPTSEDVAHALVGAGRQGASVGIGFDGPIEDPYVRLRMGTGSRVRNGRRCHTERPIRDAPPTRHTD